MCVWKQGSLLLVHGLIDENVHFRHTARLINALIRAQKHYELLLFPDERHRYSNLLALLVQYKSTNTDTKECYSPRSLKDRIFMEQV